MPRTQGNEKEEKKRKITNCKFTNKRCLCLNQVQNPDITLQLFFFFLPPYKASLLLQTELSSVSPCVPSSWHNLFLLLSFPSNNFILSLLFFSPLRIPVVFDFDEKVTLVLGKFYLAV